MAVGLTAKYSSKVEDQHPSVLLSIASLAGASGGPARSVPALAKSLSEFGTDVHLAALDLSSSLGPVAFQLPASVKVHLIPGTYSRIGRFVYSGRYQTVLEKVCLRDRIQILHDNGLWLQTNHNIASLSRELQIPRVVSPRGMATEWAMQYKSWKKKLAWSLYQRKDLEGIACFHATSNEEARSLLALGVNCPVAVIPNGVEVPPIEETRSHKSGARTALFLSRINPTKGLLNLVHAWSAVKPANWRLLIAGPDENGHRKEVEAQIESQNLGKCISFLGELDDHEKWSQYQNADLFILPTFSENFGLAIVEALASGLPVITTKGAPWHQLQKENCGWWIDIGVDPLVEAIRAATNLNDEQRTLMGDRGRELSFQFTWSSIAKRMADLYKWVLKKGQRPSFVYDHSQGIDPQ